MFYTLKRGIIEFHPPSFGSTRSFDLDKALLQLRPSYLMGNTSKSRVDSYISLLYNYVTSVPKNMLRFHYCILHSKATVLCITEEITEPCIKFNILTNYPIRGTVEPG